MRESDLGAEGEHSYQLVISHGIGGTIGSH